MIYLDHNATTPIRPEVLETMLPCFGELSGNPSSIHGAGQAARAAIDRARGAVAAALGSAPEEVHFTSGGTEADNWAIKGVAAACEHSAGRGSRSPRIVTSAIAHHAVWHSCRYLAQAAGGEVTYLPVDAFGRVSAGSVASALGEDVILLSIMHANNETGVIQPVAEIGRLARERGIPFHVDAVQALGKIDVKVDELGADLVSVSAHKINGPKGTGALYIRRGTEIEPLAHGGDHEGGVRAGTENVAGIVGFGRAVELRQGAPADRERAAVEKMRDRLEAGVSAAMEGVSVNGHPRERVGNTSSISFAGVEAEAILVGLDLEGVAISSGSACTAGTTEPSHVLLAMGLEPRRAASAVRFSLGWGNTDAEIDRLIELLPPLVARLRRISTGA